MQLQFFATTGRFNSLNQSSRGKVRAEGQLAGGTWNLLEQEPEKKISFDAETVQPYDVNNY